MAAAVIILVLALIMVLFVFRIDKVDIKGTSRVSDDTIRQEIKLDQAHDSSLLLWLLNKRANYSDNDMIRSISVRLTSPRNVLVTVVEQDLVGGIKSGDTYSYFNDKGVVILQQNKAQADIPLVSGVDVKKASTGSKLETSNDDTMSDLTDIVSVMSDYKLSVDSVESVGDGKYTAHYNKVIINLGRNSYMDEKISELASLADKLKGLSGTLHLEDYDATKDSIIFTKSADETETSTETSAETSVETSAETSAETSGDNSDYSGDNGSGDGSDYSGDNGSGDGSDYSGDNGSGDNSDNGSDVSDGGEDTSGDGSAAQDNAY